MTYIDYNRKKSKSPKKRKPASPGMGAYDQLVNYSRALIGWFALETGNSVAFVEEYYFKRLCNSLIFTRRVVDPHFGELAVTRSLRSCTAEEMEDAVQAFRTWAAGEYRIYMPAPEDSGLIEGILTEISNRGY